MANLLTAMRLRRDHSFTVNFVIVAQDRYLMASLGFELRLSKYWCKDEITFGDSFMISVLKTIPNNVSLVDLRTHYNVGTWEGFWIVIQPQRKLYDRKPHLLSHFIFIFCGPVLFGKSTPELNQNEPNSDKKTRWSGSVEPLLWSGSVRMTVHSI